MCTTQLIVHSNCPDNRQDTYMNHEGKEIEIIGIGHISLPCANSSCYTIMGSILNHACISPSVFKIDQDASAYIEACLAFGPIVIQTNKKISIEAALKWNTNHSLMLISQGNIVFGKNASITNYEAGVVVNLKSGMENPTGKGKVIFKGNEKQIQLSHEGLVQIYYNPDRGNEDHKYHNPYKYFLHISPMSAVEAYMLVNSVQDLQDINSFLSGNYALSRDINANITTLWNDGQGFDPIYWPQREMPFSGNFDGNGYKIIGLYINRPEENAVGLFKEIAGSSLRHAQIRNLELTKGNIIGDHYIGSIAGAAVRVDLLNVKCHDFIIHGRYVVGVLFGNLYESTLDGHQVKISEYTVQAKQYKGLLVGAAKEIEVYNFETQKELIGYYEE